MLDNWIRNNNRKKNADHRKPFHGLAKNIDRSCRNHGGCPYCEGNRLFSRHKGEVRQKEALAEYGR